MNAPMVRFFRVMEALVLVASLVFTVPVALWITAALAADFVDSPGGPRYYWWADYIGWGVMLTVTALTFWGVYQICKPTFDDET